MEVESSPKVLTPLLSQNCHRAGVEKRGGECLIKVMRILVLCTLCMVCKASAQSLLPIPQVPTLPNLPLSINTNGYFVFSWPFDNMGRPQAIRPTNVPTEVRSGVVRMGKFSMGSWYLKSTGEVVVYYSNSGGAGMPPTKLNLPVFYKSGIAKFYHVGTPQPFFIGISSGGQIGTMYDTNTSSLQTPAAGTNAVEVFAPILGANRIMLSLHADGKLKAWHVSYEGQLTPTNHVVDQLNDVRWVDGSGEVGLAIHGNGQVYGWTSPSTSLPLPASVSSGVAQVSAPLVAGDSLWYALKTNGTIVYWNSQGTEQSLPAEFSGKEFVKVVGLGFGNGFSLTRQGEMLGWRYWGGVSQILTLPSALQSGIRDMRITTSSRNLVAQNNQNGLLPLVDMAGGIGWTIDSSTPEGILAQGGVLDSFVYNPMHGATESNFSLSTNGDLAVATYAGLSLDVLAKLVAERILSTSNNFGLATKPEVGGAVSQGVQQVLSAPSDFNLFTPQQVQQERSAGQNDVLSNPNQWTLYTTNQIKAMAMGDLMLTRTNGGHFVLNYDIEQSDDLTSWQPYQNFAMPLTNLPTDKAFVRIKMKNQQ